MTEYENQDGEKEPNGAYTAAMRRLCTAYSAKRKILDVMQEDFEFALGKQWSEEDKNTAEKKQLKKLLTFNQVHPVLQLFAGIESQNRSDYRAYPIGKEDTLEAEAVTGMLKHVMDQSDGNYKLAEAFWDGCTCGEAIIEPYLIYEDSLINGKLRFRKGNYFEWFADPEAREYDWSDGKYVCKLTTDLSKDDLCQLYPGKEAAIKKASYGKINFDSLRNQFSFDVQSKDYPVDGDGDAPKKGWCADLAEVYYKKMVARYPVIDNRTNEIQEFESKRQSDEYVAQADQEALGQAMEAKVAEYQAQGVILGPEQLPLLQTEVMATMGGSKPAVAHKKRFIPEIWVTAVIGGMDKPLYDGPAWSYKRDPEDQNSPVKWKKYPAIPFYARKRYTRLQPNDRHLLYQGVTRQMKDPNWTFNKVRTQEMHHLNTSTNSGWQMEEGAVTEEQEKHYKEFGSAPGVVLKHKQGRTAPMRIEPASLSQGHAQFAAEIREDLQQSSGIDAEALAMSDSGTSGRAIALRQRQALVMVQEIFDNLARTKKILAQFILSQFAEIFDVESAMRVMGDAWIKENFKTPAMQKDPMTGQPVTDPATGQPVPMLDEMTGELILEFNEEGLEMAKVFFNDILNNAELGIYDVSIGEAVSAETMQLANFMEMKDLASTGFPIPPDLLIEFSGIPEGAKKKIISRMQAMEAAQAAGAMPGAASGPSPKGGPAVGNKPMGKSPAPGADLNAA